METNDPETAPSPDAGAPPVPAAPPPDEAATEPRAAEDAPIAPGVERMLAPSGTAKKIPETLLGPRPSAAFLLVVSVVSLVADVASKLWAEANLAGYPGYVSVVEGNLQLVLAKNPGGAWGLLQSQKESVRRPFFLLVSVAAITFIVTLYRRLQPNQHALRWGLPLVLGGALGNVFDRVRYGYVIDFIDYRADWVRAGNELVHKYNASHVVTDHWPTFNIADVAICVGVGLMAIDMLTARRPPRALSERLAADVPVTEVGPPADPAAPEVLSADVSTGGVATDSPTGPVADAAHVPAPAPAAAAAAEAEPSAEGAAKP